MATKTISSMTWSTACWTTGPWNNIHRFREHLSVHSLSHHRQDGPCRGDDTDAVTHIKTMDDIKGDWWAAKYLEKKQCSLYTGGCCGGSTVARRPTLVATIGTHASMNDSYSRWPWWWWQTRLTINMLNQHMCIHYAMSGEEKVAGQRSVDQQCDLLWRQARQMRYQHNCHHCKCVNASSRGELGLTIKKVYFNIDAGGTPRLRWCTPCTSVRRLATCVLSPSWLCLHDVVST